MTTLKNLKGTAIQFLDADPVVYAGSWSSGGTLNTTRQQSANGTTGIQTAAVATGGAASSTMYGQTEQYNGSAWSEINDLNTARKGLASCATSNTALVVAGGNTPTVLANTESFNGSSWSEVNDLNQARLQFSGAGGQTAGLVFGGNPGASALTESWNGSSWTEVNDLNEAVGGNSGGGVQTAAFMVYHNQHEVWNGSSWTETTELNTSRTHLASVGTTTAILSFGGENPGGSARLANTESWNGSAWTEGNDLSTGTYMNSGSGTNTLALNFTGDPGPGAGTNTSEEWSFPPATASIVQEGQMWFNSSSSTLKGYGTAAGIPAATWASGTNFPSSTYGQSGFGTQTSAMIAGGPTALTNTFTYNGTSFSSQPALNTSSPPTARYFPGAFGADGTSGLIAGGEPGVAATETWDGSAWTEVADLNTGRNLQGSFGVVTAGIVAGGYTATADSADVESWNGSSWTELSNINTARNGLGGTGGQDNGIVFGGTNNAATETWDGSAWTEVSDLNTGRRFGGSYGSTTSNSSALFAGGYTTGPVANTESWNGSSWTEVNDLNTARRSYGQGGSSAAAVLVAGESPGGATNATEEFTATAGIATITTS